MLVTGPAAALQTPGPVTDRLILRLKDVPGPGTTAEAPAPADASVAARFGVITRSTGIEGLVIERRLDERLVVVQAIAPMSAIEQNEAIKLLRAHPDVADVEPDGRVYPALVPADPRIAQQWSLFETYGVQAYGAWDVQRGSPAIVVALLDTGVLEHEDLDGARVLPGYDFVDRDGDPSDPGTFSAANECAPGDPARNSSWHGLHLAGVMTAATDNNVGVAGLNHASPLLPVRVLDKCGGLYSDIIAGIRWAAGLPVAGAPANPRPARVINLSFSSPETCTREMQRAIDDATAAGAIVVAAAGNGGGQDVAGILPAGCNNVIAVSASTRSGGIADFSNLGSRVALSAPGERIYGLWNTGTSVPATDSYVYFSGTSVAAAEVSAAVSLLLSSEPALTPANIRLILTQTARPYAGGCPAGLVCGAGILDMQAALAMVPIIEAGDPVPAATDSGGGGGGGGGCTLGNSANPGLDGAWLILAAALGLRMRRGHSGRR